MLKDKHVFRLEIIETSSHHDVMVCCREMFNYWLEIDSEANWNHLIHALEKINLNTLAQKIREDVLEGIVNSWLRSLLIWRSYVDVTTYPAICYMFMYIDYCRLLAMQ